MGAICGKKETDMKKKNLLLISSLALVLTLGASAKLGTIKKSPIETKADNDIYSLSGDFNKWGDTDLTDEDGDGIFTATVNLTAETGLKVRVNHAWGVSYGTGNVLYHTGGAFEDGADTGNIYCKTAGSYTVYFHSDTKRIDIFSSAVSYPSFKTFYIIQNAISNDYSNPRLHCWGNDFAMNWGVTPTMSSLGFSYSAEGVSGTVYTYQIPTTATGMLIRDSSLSKQTANLDLTASMNMAKFYEYEGDHLYGFSVDTAADGAYLRGDWTDGWSASGQLPMTTTVKNEEYSINGVNLSAGSAVKMVVYEGGLEKYWGQFNSVSTNDEDRYPVTKVDDGTHSVPTTYNAAVVSTGTYDIIVSYDEESEKWNYAFTGTANADLDAAVTYANGFVNAMYAQCPYNYSTKKNNDGKDASTVATEWSSQMSEYALLDDDITYYLTTKTSNITAISDFFASYDYIYGYYSEVRELNNNDADFLGRNPATIRSFNYEPLTADSAQNNVSALLVTLVSGVAVLGVGSFFLLRKKHQN